MTEIFLDENLSEYVADALNSLSKGYFPDVNVQSTKIAFGKGASDEIIIPAIGKKRGILITKDINIYRRNVQYHLCKQYKLGVFFIHLPKGSNRHWEIVKLLIDKWEELVVIINKKSLPYGYELSPRKLKKL
jgi:hypothetical protein